MHPYLKWISIFFIFLATPTLAQNEHDHLMQLIQKEWAFRMKEFPMAASGNGIHQYDDQLPEVSLKASKRRSAFWQNILNQLETIDPQALSEENRINYEFFKFVLEDDVAGVRFEDYLVPINSEGSFHSSLFFMINNMLFDRVKDYENYISRLRKFKTYAQQNMDMMRLGIKKGKTVPRVVLKGFEATIDPYIVTDPAKSQFYKPFEQMPPTIPAKEQARLRQAGKDAIQESILPAYKAFRKFLVEQYRPQAARTIAVSEWPDGQAYYQQRIHFFTTLPMTPGEVFETGQQEVKRIAAEMQTIIDSLHFEGSFADFIAFLRTDPQFYAKTPEALLQEACFIAKEIDGKLPMLFDQLPRLPYGVAPVPDAIAPKYTGGRYVAGSAKNHKAGTYWVNTYQLDSRPLYVLPALTLHEAVPGHHLQHALAEELTDMPEFRRHTYLSAYGEGWGLYAEFLGKEMHVYKTPYEDFGRLTYEMWRACRLVVDVGMHAKGWSREKAVDFLASHTALSLHEVNTEIDRYIGWPGQAVAYKIGEMKIRELRKKAEAALGDKFDVRVFHRVVLSNGSVPLFVLEDLVNRYIQAEELKN